MNNKQTTYNSRLMLVGVLLSVFSTSTILLILRNSGLSIFVQRMIAWIPFVPIFLLVDRYKYKPEKFIPMDPLVEYAIFMSMSIMFIIIAPTVQHVTLIR